MQTIRLTSIDFERSGLSASSYRGQHDFSQCNGNVEIDSNLGLVRFPVLRTRGSITALDGTSIKVDGELAAGGGIKAGWDILAGEGIRAGKGIEAGGEIKSGGDIIAGWQLSADQGIAAIKNIKAATNIKSGTSIEAGGSIEAGAGIKAGWGVKAANDITAGEGLEAGLAVQCSGTLRVRLRVFAGLSLWRLPSEAEQKILCSKFEGGAIAHGTLVERAVNSAAAGGA